ncbi:Glucose-repressible alcohol dehydrogenase transcriptional effector [Vermiconidia calcicola]|uniref:Glucose-repressible alcohol dehydrogenase transcriptional effector n=1 Tax=Vermiconidia calcicola TaxID=1690605 RepID=A0ACC3NQI1_9PEZI|nr:Glucose-repressible alcohol dehydrogenase transcriptional effector [Vermiconidia calcicola]
MADGFNRFNTGGQFYYHNQHSGHPRNLHNRNGSPIGNSRSLFQANPDTPSPNRSPGTHSPAHNPYSMYNHGNHRQNHGLLNGGAGHQNFQMNMHKGFQGQSHGHQGHHVNNQHQDHGGIGGQGGFGNHQHSISTSTLSNATPHFTPAHLQNGTPDNSSALSKPPNDQYAQHLQEYGKLKMAGDKPHFYARTTPHVSRIPGNTPSSASTKLTDADEHGTRSSHRSEEPADNQLWDAMDLGGHGLKSMGASLFRHYPHLQKIYFNHNRLSSLPPHVSRLRNLTVLDLSFNQLTEIPPEIGMLTNLKKLLLFDNRLDELPWEVGYLYQLEMLGLEGNPMRRGHDQMERLVEHGTQELVRYLREEAPEPIPPEERSWHQILDESEAPKKDTFTVISWNTLCDRAATQAAYGYAPTAALSWQRRKYMILDELKAREADILTLQEVDIENYNEWFAPSLASQGYKGVFQAKGRARTMSEKEAKIVDGCATFYKGSKYLLLHKHVINYSHEAINRPDMKGEHDVYNRVMPRDHIALVLFLENRQTGTRLIVVNTHLTWEVWFSDVKIVQVAILMEHLAKKADEYARWPPTKDKDKEQFRFANEDSVDALDIVKADPVPSVAYDTGKQIPLLVCGDFNSTHDSGVHELITQGSLSATHPELGSQKYGDFTRNGMAHPFNMQSSYNKIGELPFTNWTPDFRQVIDYVWYSTNTLQVAGLLGEVDRSYMSKVPGFPNYHFPSDHLLLMAEYSVKEKKERKQVEADFGPSRRESSRQ